MIYLALWFVSFCNAVFTPKTIKSGVVFLVSCVFFMLIILRGETVDRDYITYLKYIDDVKLGNTPTLGGGVFDNVVCFFWYTGIPVFFVFIFYACALPIKIKLFYRAGANCGGNYIGSVFLVYVGFFVYLHDFTQMRVSLAIAIAYYAVYMLTSLKSWKKACFYLGVSIAVHPSLLVLTVATFIMRKASFLSLLCFLIFSVVGCYFDFFNLLINAFISYLDIPVLLIYQGLSQEGVDIINPFGLFPLLNLAIALIICFLGMKYNIQNPWIDLMLKFAIFSQIAWFSLSAIPALSGRISQLFLFSFVFLIPLISHKYTRRMWVLSAIYSFIGLAAFIYKGSLLNEYSFIF